MADILRLFQMFVAPAIFISAGALLLLSLNVRLMGMVTRLRQFQRERHIAASTGRQPEAEALGDQIESIDSRAELVRKAFLLVLVSLAGTIVSCLLLGLGLYWANAHVLAAAVFVGAILCLLVGVFYYLAEILVALSSVRDEAKYFRFMDLSRHAEGEERTPAERRDDWQRDK